MHFPGACTLKAVIVQLDDEYAMCVLRCTRRVDLDALAKVSGSKSVRLATAAAMREIAPAAEVCSYLPCVSPGVSCEHAGACVLQSCTLVSLGSTTELRSAPVIDHVTCLQHGRLPPFGHLYGMRTYLDTARDDECLSGLVDVAFSAGALALACFRTSNAIYLCSAFTRTAQTTPSSWEPFESLCSYDRVICA